MTTKESNKKGFARKLIEDIDENWFSFLSGVFANIPISLLFCFQSWGETYFSHSFLYCNGVAFYFVHWFVNLCIQVYNDEN